MGLHDAGINCVGMRFASAVQLFIAAIPGRLSIAICFSPELIIVVYALPPRKRV